MTTKYHERHSIIRNHINNLQKDLRYYSVREIGIWQLEQLKNLLIEELEYRNEHKENTPTDSE